MLRMRNSDDGEFEPGSPAAVEDVSMADSAPSEGLQFATDQGSGRAVWMALALVLLIVAWMASGIVFPAPEEEETQVAVAGPVAVAVKASTAEPVIQLFVAEGQALPDRETLIRAEISGEIADVFVEKGDLVETNQVLARFDAAGGAAELERAKENLRVAQREFDNAEQLRNRGAATADRVSQARAALVAAEADVTSAQQDLDDTVLKAPFAGRLDRFDVDVGEFVGAGTDVAQVIDTDPLTIVVQVPQQALASLSKGQPAQVRFITGQEVVGQVMFIGASADNETRTFRAEIEIPNQDAAIPAGLSAQVRIPTGETVAHFVSPAILSLGTDGTLGIKTVDGTDKVVFNDVEIVRAQTDGIWVSGLPDTARIITVGQGYVSDGELVNATPDQKFGQGEAAQ